MPVLSPVTATLARLKAARARHRERHRPSGFQITLAESIHQLRPDHWDALAATASVFQGRTYLSVLEAHAPDNLRPRYALVYLEGRPVAAVVAQAVSVAGDQVPAPPERETPAARATRRALSKVKERILVCGNLLSWGFHGVAFAPDLDPQTLWPGVAEALYRLRRADKLFGETALVMVKDLTDGVDAGAGPLRRFSYRPFDTEPNMVLDLDGGWRTFDDYLGSLRSTYRNAAKKVRKDCEAEGIRLERLDAAAVRAHAGDLLGLYHQVHDQQKLRLVTLQEDYLPALAEAFGAAFRTRGAFAADGKLVGFITTLKDGAGAVGYYIGFDKATAAAGVPLYLRLLQVIIEDGLELGATRVSLGRSALQPKASLGAKPEPMRCLVRHRIPAFNAVLKGLLTQLPDPDLPPERNPFKG